MHSYNTRNRGVYQPGYYSTIQRTPFEITVRPNVRRTDMSHVVKSLNYAIVCKLKAGRPNDGVNMNCRVELTTREFAYLKQKYKFTRALKESAQFMDDFQLQTKRYLNERNCVTANQFQFRVLDGRKIRFCRERDYGNLQQIQAPAHLFCTFVRVPEIPD